MNGIPDPSEGDPRAAVEGLLAVAPEAIVADLRSALAGLQGYWLLGSPTPPTTTTMYGVDVWWIDTAEQLTPVPVKPPSPTWNDATGQFTVPSGVVGVDYVWTSGGGGVGATVTQGATIGTSGAYPRSVVITPVEKPGYVLAAGVVPFRHDFPNPALVTVIASDAFTGGDVATISGRTLDNTLGGVAAKTYAGAGAFFSIVSGICVPTTTTGWHTIDMGQPNHEVQFDLVSATAGAEGTSDKPFMLCIGGAAANQGVVLQLGRRNWTLGVTVSAGGLEIYPGTPAAGTVTPLGTWNLRIYLKSVTVTDPNGVVYSYDGNFVDATHGLPDAKRGNLATWRNQANPNNLTFDNLILRQLG